MIKIFPLKYFVIDHIKDTWLPAYNAGDVTLILGGEDPLEKGMATHSSILAWRIPMDRGALQATVYGVPKSQTRLND